MMLRLSSLAVNPKCVVALIPYNNAATPWMVEMSTGSFYSITQSDAEAIFREMNREEAGCASNGDGDSE